MGTRMTSGNGLLPLLLVGGALVVAVFGGSKIVNIVTAIVGSGTEVIGTGDHALLVADDEKALLDQCPTQQIIAAKVCGDKKVVIFNATKMPFIARNVSLAWGAGKPSILPGTRRSTAGGSIK